MRSFPNGTRNCYTVWPVNEGQRYLVRAGFLYGNYDGKNSPPEFDLYLGVNLWQTVKTLSDDTVLPEIIVISPANALQICLVKTSRGNAVHLGVGGEAGTEFNLHDGQQLAISCLKRASSRLWRKPEHQVRFSLPLVLCLSISLISVKQVSGGSLRPHLVCERQTDRMDDGEHR